jgi:sterol desaturase/sphingolipid hydroxylase (fatty acid hydroxylase superfamily)
MDLWFVVYIFGLVVVLLFTEQLFPAEQGQPLRNTAFNLLWYPLITLALVAINLAGVGALVGWLVREAGGPFVTPASPTTFPEECACFLVYLVVFDFFGYWFHRLQHVSRWFWPTHKLHHSDQSVNASTMFRHHWTHHLLTNFLVTLPIGVLVGLGLPGGRLWLFLYFGFAIFVHMNVRIGFGRWSWVLCSPQFHRIHHSVLKEHHGKNLASFFPIWDVLFGTYHHPRPGEYPPTGIGTKPFANSIWDAFIEPFRDWYRALKKLWGRRRGKLGQVRPAAGHLAVENPIPRRAQPDHHSTS